MNVPVNHQPAIQHLRQSDPVMTRLIEQFGACRLGKAPRRDSLLSGLGKAIIYQQISIKAASTVYSRFLALYPGSRFPDAAALLATPQADLRAIGLPPTKVAYLQNLAQEVLQGLPDLAVLERMPDEEIFQRLTAIKGIGPWSVQMLLMFQLRRWDILPVKDLGLQLAMQEQYNLPERPSPQRVTEIAAVWQPYRTIGSWYLWQSRDASTLELLDVWD